MSDDEWEVVVDQKRVKREERQARASLRDEAEGEYEEAKRLRQEADNGSDSSYVHVSSVSARPTAPSSSRPHGVEPTRVSLNTFSSRRAQRNARKNRSKSSAKAKVPRNERELVECFEKLLSGESRPVTLAELGAHLQESTRTSWNKAFKSDYGPMVKFLQTHSGVFTVSKNNGETEVSLRSSNPPSSSSRAPRSNASSLSSSSARAVRSPKRRDAPKKSGSSAKNGAAKNDAPKNGASKAKSVSAAQATPARNGHAPGGGATSNGTSKRSKKKSKKGSASKSSSSSVTTFFFLVLVLFILSGLYLSYHAEIHAFLREL